MKQVKIEVPITELDIEQFKKLFYEDTEPFTWNFESNNKDIKISITFVKDEE